MYNDIIMKTIYVENNDGIYAAYANKHDPYVCGKLVEAKVAINLAEHLCETTRYYNEAQDILRQICNN